MIIVAGHLTVEANSRDSYLTGCVDVVRLARESEGCLDFSIAADLLDSGRIDIYERWDDVEHLHAFRGSGPDAGQQAAILSADVREFECR